MNEWKSTHPPGRGRSDFTRIEELAFIYIGLGIF